MSLDKRIERLEALLRGPQLSEEDARIFRAEMEEVIASAESKARAELEAGDPTRYDALQEVREWARSGRVEL